MSHSLGFDSFSSIIVGICIFSDIRIRDLFLLGDLETEEIHEGVIGACAFLGWIGLGILLNWFLFGCRASSDVAEEPEGSSEHDCGEDDEEE